MVLPRLRHSVFQTQTTSRKPRDRRKQEITELSNEIKSGNHLVNTSQICVKETKNLDAEPQTTEVLRRNETDDFKEKILEYAWWLKKNGKSDSTIVGRTKILKTLTKRGANLYDPETLKDAIAKQPWSNGRKNNACRRLLIIPKNGRRNLGSTTIPNSTKTTLHPQRNRN